MYIQSFSFNWPLILGSILCFLPLMFSWKFIETQEENKMAIYSAISSKIYQYSLIVSISSSIPMLLDFILDTYLMILLYAIPLNSPRLLVCIFNLRHIVVMNTIFIILSEYASSLFLIVCSNRISRHESTRLHKKLAEVKRSFIRFISHEVRTPLNVMKLGLDIVKSEMEDHQCSHESLDCLNDVRSSCNQAVYILNELLNFQKIEAGILSLDRLLLSAWDVLTGSLTSSEEMARKVGVQLVIPTVGSTTACTLKTAMIHVDGKKLRQALEFIFLSSVKSTARGGILTITASVTEGVISTTKTYSTEVQPILRLHISSSGIGKSLSFIFLKQHSVTDVVSHTMTLMNESMHTEKNTGFAIEDARSIIEVHNGNLLINDKNNNHLKNIIIIELPAKIISNNNNNTSSNNFINDTNNSNSISNNNSSSYKISELSAKIVARTTRLSTKADSLKSLPLLSLSLSSKSFLRKMTTTAATTTTTKTSRKYSSVDNRKNSTLIQLKPTPDYGHNNIDYNNNKEREGGDYTSGAIKNRDSNDDFNDCYYNYFSRNRNSSIDKGILLHDMEKDRGMDRDRDKDRDQVQQQSKLQTTSNSTISTMTTTTTSNNELCEFNTATDYDYDHSVDPFKSSISSSTTNTCNKNTSSTSTTSNMTKTMIMMRTLVEDEVNDE
eukprot:gene3416-6779_t